MTAMTHLTTTFHPVISQSVILYLLRRSKNILAIGEEGGGCWDWGRRWGRLGKGGGKARLRAPSQGSRTIGVFLLVALQVGEKGTFVEVLLC
jgi:hypothetical protein